MSYLEERDVPSCLYLSDPSAPFQGDRGDHPFFRIQNLLQEFYESIGKTLHLSDLINHNETGQRVEKRNRVEKIFKTFDVHLILTNSMRASDPFMGKDSSLSFEADQLKSLPFASFFYLFRIKPNRMKTLQRLQEFFYQSCLAHPGVL